MNIKLAFSVYFITLFVCYTFYQFFGVREYLGAGIIFSPVFASMIISFSSGARYKFNQLVRIFGGAALVFMSAAVLLFVIESNISFIREGLLFISGIVLLQFSAFMALLWIARFFPLPE